MCSRKIEQQANLHRNHERIRDQRMRVLVERFLPEENNRVAGEVQNQIREEQKAVTPMRNLVPTEEEKNRPNREAIADPLYSRISLSRDADRRGSRLSQDADLRSCLRATNHASEPPS